VLSRIRDEAREHPVRRDFDVGATVDGFFIAAIHAGALGILALLGALATAGASEANQVLPFSAIPLEAMNPAASRPLEGAGSSKGG
jgi:hypothetical protein